MPFGFWEVAIVLIIILILFGAGKLPNVMGDIAKGVKSFKEGMKDDPDSSSTDKKSSKKDESDKTAS